MRELQNPDAHKAPYLREQIGVALLFVANEACLAQLRERYADEQDINVKGYLLLALSQFQAIQTVELLLEALSLSTLAARALVGLRQQPVAFLLSEENRIKELSQHPDQSIALESERLLWRLKVLGMGQRDLIFAFDGALSRFKCLYRQCRDAIYVQGPRPEHAIKRSERRLGVTFPPSFRSFLGEFGGGNVEGHEIFGLPYAHDVQDMFLPNVVAINLDKRIREGLPKRVLAFYADEQGYPGYYVMDLGQLDSRGEALVCRWDVMVSAEWTELTPIAVNFGSALVEITEDILSMTDHEE
jgi:hypothetical protein